MCLASCPNPPRPRRRPSSSAVFRVVRAKLPPIAFSMHPSSILANRLDPQPTRTKDDDEDEDEQEEGWDMALYRFRVLTLGNIHKAVRPERANSSIGRADFLQQLYSEFSR